jgi:hypothetical protein
MHPNQLEQNEHELGAITALHHDAPIELKILILRMDLFRIL